MIFACVLEPVAILAQAVAASSSSSCPLSQVGPCWQERSAFGYAVHCSAANLRRGLGAGHCTRAENQSFEEGNFKTLLRAAIFSKALGGCRACRERARALCVLQHNGLRRLPATGDIGDLAGFTLLGTAKCSILDSGSRNGGFE